jgi:cytochrome P450
MLMLHRFRQTRHTDGSTFSPAEAEHECFLLTVASQDTTAAFISPLIGHIAQDKQVSTKLMAEICEFEKQGLLSLPVVQYRETTIMPYFMACVRETLRLCPPTPIILPRYSPKGGMAIDGMWVPETAEIGANPYLIHRNKDMFGEDVGVYRPERWLENPERTHLMDRYDFVWGYGSRKCVGKNIALMDGQKFVLQVYQIHSYTITQVLTVIALP